MNFVFFHQMTIIANFAYKVYMRLSEKGHKYKIYKGATQPIIFE